MNRTLTRATLILSLFAALFYCGHRAHQLYSELQRQPTVVEGAKPVEKKISYTISVTREVKE